MRRRPGAPGTWEPPPRGGLHPAPGTCRSARPPERRSPAPRLTFLSSRLAAKFLFPAVLEPDPAGLAPAAWGKRAGPGPVRRASGGSFRLGGAEKRKGKKGREPQRGDPLRPRPAPRSRHLGGRGRWFSSSGPWPRCSSPSDTIVTTFRLRARALGSGHPVLLLAPLLKSVLS